MNTRTITIIVIIIIVIAGLAGFGVFQTDQAGDTQSKGSDIDRFADIELKNYEGNPVTLGEFRGKPMVINSWAVWCPFCRNELPDFAELQEEFGDEITVVAIDRQEPLEKAKGYTDELGITDDMLFLLDPNDEFYKSIGGFSMPETIFVNSTGEIVVHKRGPMDLVEMVEHVNKIL
ncbi:MAG: TlpA disulfide reductase family protein [Candidatus Paceibacterota bacterium]